jgi:hypothetical protein
MDFAERKPIRIHVLPSDNIRCAGDLNSKDQYKSVMLCRNHFINTAF